MEFDKLTKLSDVLKAAVADLRATTERYIATVTTRFVEKQTRGLFSPGAVPAAIKGHGGTASPRRATWRCRTCSRRRG